MNDIRLIVNLIPKQNTSRMGLDGLQAEFEASIGEWAANNGCEIAISTAPEIGEIEQTIEEADGMIGLILTESDAASILARRIARVFDGRLR